MKKDFFFQENKKLELDISLLKEKLNEVDEYNSTLILDTETKTQPKSPGLNENGEKLETFILKMKFKVHFRICSQHN